MDNLEDPHEDKEEQDTEGKLKLIPPDEDCITDDEA